MNKYISRKALLAYIAFGSNIAPRQIFIEQALFLLQERAGNILAVSSLFETLPAGQFAEKHPQKFLNGVCKLETKMSAEQLLDCCQNIETIIGRKRAFSKGYLSRKIDLDLILYGDLVRESTDLSLPHPRFQERAFVLLPLREVLEPEWREPRSGQNIDQLIGNLSLIESSASCSSFTLAGA